MMESVPERQPELAVEDWRATGLLRVESRLMRTRAVGVRGGLLTLVPFRNTTLLYHAKWQSQTTQDDFSVFFVGRSDGLWRTAFGGRPLADGLCRTAFGGRPLSDGLCRTAFGPRRPAAKKSPRNRFVSAKTNRFRGAVAPSSRLTGPRARTLRRGGVAHT